VANSAARPHVPEEELHAYGDGELSPSQRVEIAEHLLGCMICRSQQAMVEAVRLRSATLLAIAVPVQTRRHEVPALPVVAPRRRWIGYATAVAAALVGTVVWTQLSPAGTGVAGSQLANSFGISKLFGLGVPIVDTAAGIRGRQTEMAARTASPPQVITSLAEIGHLTSAAPVAVPAEVDPVFTNDWSHTNLDDAIKLGNGSLARVSGVPVANVRIHPSAIGGRPTFMVRQRLQDGRPVWVFEGLEEDITPFNQVLLASGIKMSMITRTRPDYVGMGADLRVTTRMVTVVGHLPVDSLNILVSRLTLR